MERMHSREDRIRRTEQLKREREERYARRTRQRTTGSEESRYASEPPAVGSHTPKPIHQRSQSEGGGNGETSQGHEDLDEENLNQGESEEDEDDLIIGTPLGTYVLRTKGTGKTTGTHTPVDKAQDKTHQGNTTEEDLFDQRSWEKLRRNFEEQFSYEDSGFSRGSTQNQTDQEVKRPITQEKFDELRRKFEERFKNSKTLELTPESAHHHHLQITTTHLVLETTHPIQLTWLHNNGEQRFPYRPIKVRQILILTCKNLTMFVLPTRKTQMQSSCNYL